MSARWPAPPSAVALALPRACAACPWRLSNQGTRHPGGWYTKANLRRLWAKLRKGDGMTCHPTDPANPVPDGYKAVPANAVTHECTGATILKHREYIKFQRIANERSRLGLTDGLRQYKARHPVGLTQDGLLTIVNALVFAGTPWGGRGLARVDLSDADVGYEPLGAFTEQPVRK